MIEPIKRSSSYWHRRSKWKVIDPDGWDRRIGALQRDWCTPITEGEYKGKEVRSTCTNRKDDSFGNGMDSIICGDEDNSIPEEQVISEETITDQEDLRAWQREMQDATNALVIRVNSLAADVGGIPRKNSRYKGNWFKMAQEAVGAVKGVAEQTFQLTRQMAPVPYDILAIKGELQTLNVNLTRIADAMESPLWDIERKSRG